MSECYILKLILEIHKKLESAKKKFSYTLCMSIVILVETNFFGAIPILCTNQTEYDPLRFEY